MEINRFCLNDQDNYFIFDNNTEYFILNSINYVCSAESRINFDPNSIASLIQINLIKLLDIFLDHQALKLAIKNGLTEKSNFKMLEIIPIPTTNPKLSALTKAYLTCWEYLRLNRHSELFFQHLFNIVMGECLSILDEKVKHPNKKGSSGREVRRNNTKTIESTLINKCTELISAGTKEREIIIKTLLKLWWEMEPCIRRNSNYKTFNGWYKNLDPKHSRLKKVKILLKKIETELKVIN